MKTDSDILNLSTPVSYTHLMRITDNGIGMTEEDARLAILRHATSKIQQVEDLFDICLLYTS